MPAIWYNLAELWFSASNLLMRFLNADAPFLADILARPNNCSSADSPEVMDCVGSKLGGTFFLTFITSNLTANSQIETAG